ncbi:penicillin-binding protein 1A family [Candidatus Magnetomorum sp. HK-1]|nr:penicillin-binding protein 1A family [Candidatus Magnetomorum sp. HK-1]
MKKFISLKIIIISMIAAIVSGFVIGGLIVLKLDMPEIRQLDHIRPPSTTAIKSRNDQLVDEWFIEKRESLAFSEIPKILIQAVLTTEDRSFYYHSGVSIRGILRAIIKDILARKYVEGASTITQQLAKTLFLSNEKKITRKIKEAILAFQLERRYTKDEILTRYLNQVYFGSGAYGVKSAANLYFGKKLSDLSISECALIAGLPKAPSWYSPLINIKQAKQRRNVVLRQMADTGIIQMEIYKKSCKEPIRLKKNKNKSKPVVFLDEVRNTLEERFGSEYIYQKGLSVQTTIDKDLQIKTEKAVEYHLEKIERRNSHLEKRSLQAAVVVIQNSTGDVLSMVGGRKYKENYFNRATKARRQPGSVIKPLIYAYAIENGYSQASLILDAPIIFGNWQPENYLRNYSGEMTLRKSLVRSLNIPSVRLLDTLGMKNVFKFCQKMGIETDSDLNLTFALGSSEVSLLSITAAYMVFPNQGIYIHPGFIRQVKDRRGRMQWIYRPKKRWIMSRSSAAVMTDILKAVITEGTAKSAQVLNFPVAGKTGTTDDNRDVWFIGFSADVCVGVWVGMDTNESIGERETGGRAALPIWIDVMRFARQKYSKKTFDIPDDTIYVTVDVNTGKRSENNNPSSTSMLLKKNSLPDYK